MRCLHCGGALLPPDEDGTIKCLLCGRDPNPAEIVLEPPKEAPRHRGPGKKQH